MLIADEYDNENDMYVGAIKTNDKEYILMRNAGRYNEDVRIVKYFPDYDKEELADYIDEVFLEEL